MINTKELRIGNLVTIDNPKAWEELKNVPMAVTEIKTEAKSDYFTKSDSIISVSCSYKDYKYWDKYSQFNEFISPIPLTEEWILKLGFSRDKENRLKIYLDNFQIEYDVDTVCLWIEHEGLEYNHIKHVHQLQNLYFVLTNKELTLKES